MQNVLVYFSRTRTCAHTCIRTDTLTIPFIFSVAAALLSIPYHAFSPVQMLLEAYDAEFPDANGRPRHKKKQRHTNSLALTAST